MRGKRRRELRPWAKAVLIFLILICFIPLAFLRKDNKRTVKIESLSGNTGDINKDYKKVDIKVYDHKKEEVYNMDLEEYILGVVAAEVPMSYEPEAIRAQAIAARTYAYKKFVSSPEKDSMGADVCTNHEHCQAYISYEDREKNWTKNFETYEEKLNQAVLSTANLILVYDDQPIMAFFHSTSGGATENSENVFSIAYPYLKSVNSPGEEDGLRYRSETRVSFNDFVKKIKASYVKSTVSKSNIKSNVYVKERYESGRVKKLYVSGVEIEGTEVRKLFNLYSTNFELIFDDKTNEIVFETLGYGHGVGMSQVGANAMAKQGNTYFDILMHYYTGVEIKKL